MASTGRPSYGRRLMPMVLDELAAAEPNRLYAAVPKSSHVEEGFRDITVADMARCVNFMARWIEDVYGKSDTFETISFIGIPDLRGAAIFQAAVKCGYKLLLPSPRNPPATNKSLMVQTGCTKLLHAAEAAPIVKQIRDIVPGLQLSTIPSFEEMLSSSPEHYPFNKDFDAARNEPVVVLHSSGSTGLPKPITMTHGSFAVLDNEHNIPDVPGRRRRDWSMWTFQGEARVYTVFPFFHLAGFLSLTLQTIFMNASPVLGPPHLIPDATLLKAVISKQKLRSMFLPPAVIEQLLHEPNGIDYFRGLDFLVYSGAPFSPAIGNQLSEVVEIISPFGSTEVYPQPELAPSREDWAYHEFNPFVKHEMRLYDETEGTYELVILVDQDSKDTAAAYHNLPGISEYPTKDLFVRHAQKPQLYKYYGRRDDIIVLANGEKFNPIPLEVHVQNHPSLKGVFVIGNGRRQAALLLEPKEPLEESGRKSLLQEIWPLVTEANAFVPGQGRIQQSRLLCALPQKPFTRTGKGTIVRRLTEEAYKEEIDRLYLDTLPQANSGVVSLNPTVTYQLSTVISFIRSIVAPSFPAISSMKDDEDFLAYGLDSEQIVEIVFNLKRNLQAQTDKPVEWISPRTIFRDSTVSGLSNTIHSFLNDGHIPEEDLNLSRSHQVEDAVARYSEGLPSKPTTPKPCRPVSSVAVIGSTGFLGRYIVATLIKDPAITRVYCLSRSADDDAARKKHETMLLELDPEIIGGGGSLLEKLEFLTIDLEKPSLGLNTTDTKKLLADVDVIVLNAWKSNFVLPLRSFDPFLMATHETIKLASSPQQQQVRIVFVSSLAAVGNLARRGTVPETLVQDPLAAFNNGYGQSKLAAERILAAGYQVSGVPVTVARVTQIGGPASGGGKWADQGWISAIVKTAKTIDLVPGDGPAIDWLPVDIVAEMIHKSVVMTGKEGEEEAGLRFYNFTHPDPQPWDLLVDVLRSSLNIRHTATLREWIGKLRDIRGTDAEDKGGMPAITLLDYYEEEYGGGGQSGSGYEIGETVRDLGVEVAALDKGILKTWLSGWDL
ncbi:hypothetical protein GGS20DRAFT_561714 [Poronia punctata]|nr:hypothetical protein GGS20DRAFT_561714 [Poronia punctata]